ncbi:uncharacterized protein G2W53_010371 [Senna tora]|uniref:Uncharacterized protein n=1 Tax=Senna tora TaxID=362788 RepID=A0A834X0V0_9FABA|nr:uncharacterized protein G2W53_010371 [Senna tora]
MGGAWIMSQCIPDDKSRSDLGNLHELRGKRLVAQVSQTRRFALYSRTGVVLMPQLESSLHGRSVDHVPTYSGRQIAVKSRKPSPITRQKTCCATWEEHGSCLNVSRMTNHGQISETFTNYEAKDLLRKSVDHVSTYPGRQITVGSLKPSRITRQKTCCASESNTSVRVVFENRSGFDALIGVALAWVERGSCLNVFRTTNRGHISETFTNYEAKELLRKSVDHVSTFFGRQIAVGSQKPSRITRQKTCCASESNTSVRVVFANRSGFDAPIGVVLAWEERGTCLNVFWTTNRGHISETFTNYEAKDFLRKHERSVVPVLTYSRRQIAVTSRKPSRITRQKTCCARESNTLVRVVFENRIGFDAPIGVFLAWEERGSCLNILQMTNRHRNSETFTNYEAKDSLCK